MWTILSLTLVVVSLLPCARAITFLVTYSGYDYYKVQASGPMTSANVKVTCEAAGYLTPCPGDGSCPWSSDDCLQTGLQGGQSCHSPMREIFLTLCGGYPEHNFAYPCPALDGVYIYMTDWRNYDASCGFEDGLGCFDGDVTMNRFALCARPAGQQEYLTTVENWAFYKVRATGAMTNANVKATCEAAGMGYPCFNTGVHGCDSDWAPECVKLDYGGDLCDTSLILSEAICGDPYSYTCQPLNDVFVYSPTGGAGSCGLMAAQMYGPCLDGALFSNTYAVCAVEASNPCARPRCPYDFQCENRHDHYVCLAGNESLPETFTCNSASCPKGMYCKQEGKTSFSCRVA